MLQELPLTFGGVMAHVSGDRHGWRVLVTLMACIGLCMSGGTTVGVASAEQVTPRGPCAARDYIQPLVTDVRFSQARLDITNTDAAVDVLARVTDRAAPGRPASGVKTATASVSGVVGGTVELARVGETSTWRGRLAVPRGTSAGSAVITGVDAFDAARNEAEPFRQDQTTWHPVLAVTSQHPDTTPPSLTSLTLSSTVIDTRDGPASVEVTIHATDDVGVQHAHLEIATINEGDDRVFAAAFTEQSEGTFTGRLDIPSWLGTDTWSIDAAVDDGINFSNSIPEGSPGTVSIISRVDRHRPDLSSVRLAVKKVDTRRHAKRYSVTARATDAETGVQSVSVTLYPRPVEGEELGLSNADPPVFRTTLHLSSGSAANGTWSGVLRVGRCARVGTYDVFADVFDHFGRFRGYHGSRLTALGAPAQVDIVSRARDTFQPTVGRRALSSRRILVVFNEGVINVTARNLRLIDYNPASRVVDVTRRCLDARRHRVSCSGADAPVRRVVLTVARRTALRSVWRVDANAAGVAPQITDTFGNPLKAGVLRL
jgi:hypothetical protein